MKTEKAIKKTAGHFGVSADEVEREMSAAIDAAFENPSLTLSTLFPDGKPTTQEFISKLAERATNLKSSL